MNWYIITDEQIKTNLSDYLSEKFNYDYTYLANLFTEVKGITIEKFYLTHKIEKVKELIVYDELNLSEIAFKCTTAVWPICQINLKKSPD